MREWVSRIEKGTNRNISPRCYLKYFPWRFASCWWLTGCLSPCCCSWFASWADQEWSRCSIKIWWYGRGGGHRGGDGPGKRPRASDGAVLFTCVIEGQLWNPVWGRKIWRRYEKQNKNRGKWNTVLGVQLGMKLMSLYATLNKYSLNLYVQ
jgi:hypothetical protein